MSLLAQLVLLAYPRTFRRDYGAEWHRTVRDMRIHGREGALRVGLALTVEALTTGIHMRWENLMTSTRTGLSILAAGVAVAALVVGSPAIAMLDVAIVALIGLQFAGQDHPITPSDPSLTRRWYLWLASAAGTSLIGFAVVAIDGDGELTTASWTTWIASWAAAAVLGMVGICLAVTRLVMTRH